MSKSLGYLQQNKWVNFRLLENYILNGPKDDAVDQVVKDLSDQNRKNPQELDIAMISFLRDVLRYKGDGHVETARKIRID